VQTEDGRRELQDHTVALLSHALLNDQQQGEGTYLGKGNTRRRAPQSTQHRGQHDGWIASSPTTTTTTQRLRRGEEEETLALCVRVVCVGCACVRAG